jgi:hypothetical protein
VGLDADSPVAGARAGLSEAPRAVIEEAVAEDAGEDARVLLALLTAASPREFGCWLSDDDWSVWSLAEVLGANWAADSVLALSGVRVWPERLRGAQLDLPCAAGWEVTREFLAMVSI